MRMRGLAWLVVGLSLANLAFAAVPVAAAGPSAVDQSDYQALQWRLIGPFRGGRVLAVAGIPGDNRLSLHLPRGWVQTDKQPHFGALAFDDTTKFSNHCRSNIFPGLYRREQAAIRATWSVRKEELSVNSTVLPLLHLFQQVDAQQIIRPPLELERIDLRQISG